MTTEQNKSPPFQQAIHALKQGIAAQSDDLKHQKLCEALDALRKDSIGTLALALADALLDMHCYGQTDFVYRRSPACAKTHQALVEAGYLTADGHLTEIAKARGQQ